MNNSTSTALVVERLRDEIARGQPGERLTSTRRLIESHHVSPVTVAKALALLAAEGAIVTRPGAGSFIGPRRAVGARADYSWQTVALEDRATDPGPMNSMLSIEGEDGMIPLGTGFPHRSLLCGPALGGALARAGRLPDAWDAPPVRGLRGLRTWFAQAAGGTVDRADVIITGGGQAAISTTVRALIPAGGALLVESPTYPGTLQVARSASVRTVPVPTDRDGVIPELLAEAFARTGARAFYCQPTFHNPTGTVLAPARREAVIAVAAAAGAFIIEDDFAHWLSHGRPSPPALLTGDDDGRVVYLTSLSKAASPSLRVGALIARGPVAERLASMRLIDDLFVARAIQEAALDLVSRPAWHRHQRALAIALTRRCQLLAAAIGRHLPATTLDLHPRGGLHLWLRLPSRIDDVAVAAEAHRAGVAVVPGRGFFPAEPSAPHLRLTFSAVFDEADLEVGITRLARAAPALAELST